MSTVNYKTDYEIQQTAFNLLHKQLGITNLIRFMQQYDKGYGNYTKERDDWQKEGLCHIEWIFIVTQKYQSYLPRHSCMFLAGIYCLKSRFLLKTCRNDGKDNSLVTIKITQCNIDHASSTQYGIDPKKKIQ